MGVKDFECKMLSSKGRYYRLLGQDWMNALSTEALPPSRFLATADDVLNAELAIVSEYNLNEKIMPKLLELYKNRLLVLATDTFFGTDTEGGAMQAMLVSNDCDSLSRLYRLYSSVGDCYQRMKVDFAKFLESQGQNVLSAFELSRFYDQCLWLVEECFHKNPHFLRVFVSYYLTRTLNADSSALIERYLY